jgi:hypothetical protein
MKRISHCKAPGTRAFRPFLQETRAMRDHHEKGTARRRAFFSP